MTNGFAAEKASLHQAHVSNGHDTKPHDKTDGVIPFRIKKRTAYQYKIGQKSQCVQEHPPGHNSRPHFDIGVYLPFIFGHIPNANGVIKQMSGKQGRRATYKKEIRWNVSVYLETRQENGYGQQPDIVGMT